MSLLAFYFPVVLKSFRFFSDDFVFIFVNMKLYGSENVNYWY